MQMKINALFDSLNNWQNSLHADTAHIHALLYFSKALFAPTSTPTKLPKKIFNYSKVYNFLVPFNLPILNNPIWIFAI
jgi:hypothetical protein